MYNNSTDPKTNIFFRDCTGVYSSIDDDIIVGMVLFANWLHKVRYKHFINQRDSSVHAGISTITMGLSGYFGNTPSSSYLNEKTCWICASG